MHWQVDRQLDLGAMPTTYVHQADAALAVKTRNEFGTIGTYKVSEPKTVTPPAVHPELYSRLERIKEGSYEEFGVSRLAATAHKPAGLDSGAALREYRDQTTQRFAQQEAAFEQLNLDAILLTIQCAKEMAEAEGVEPPTVIKKLARGRKKIDWSDVDPEEAKVEIYAASTLSRTPSGRTQMAMEMAQAGVISQDEARRLMAPFDPLDLESTISLYQTALDDIDLTIEEMLDGEPLVPEPFQNLDLGIWRVQQAYLRARADDAPEEVLENLRQWITMAGHILSPPEPPVDPAAAMAGPEMGMGAEPGAMAGALEDPATMADAAPQPDIPATEGTLLQ
jgi:hypothetical protein